jgi:signal transduction histidine kinase
MNSLPSHVISPDPPHEMPTSISDLQGALSERALRAARMLSPVFTAGYLIAYGVTGHASFLWVAAVTLVIGVSSLLRLRSKRHDVEFLIAASGIGFALIWPAVPDMVRGSLSAALVLFPMMGSLLLRPRARTRMAVLFAAIIIGQSAWAVVGALPPSTLFTHVAVSLLALFFGLRATRIFRRTMEGSESRATAAAEHYQGLFERVPSPIWEEDWSGVVEGLERLRESGVTDLRGHLRAHPDAFFRLWSTIRYLDVNPAGIALAGAGTRDEAIANVRPLPPPDPGAEGFIEEYQAVWDGRDRMTFEAMGSTVTGEPLDLQISWVAGRRPDGSLDLDRVVVAMTDVTALRTAQRQLDAMLQSKDELVASVAHELRTPLTGIMGLALEVRDNLAALDTQEAVELLDLIASESVEVTQLVEDLMIAARADLDTLAVRPETLDIRAEIDLVVSQLTGDKVPVVTVDHTTRAWADSLRLRQIVRNLLSNAERYGGPNVRVVVTTETGQLVLRVIDDGAGIPADLVDEIFTPFGQASANPSHPGSMGLGLAVSKRLARLMGGDLTYRYADGCVFELRLPASNETAVAV